MKKKILRLFAVILVFGVFLTACGQAQVTSTTSQSAASPGTSTDKKTETEKDDYTITFIMPNRDQFLTTMEEGMKAKSKELNVNLTSQDVQNDTSKVIQFVESARNAGDDAVVVLPVDSETVPQIVEAAGDMKVVIVNRAPKDTSIFKGDLVFVGSNEIDAGTFQGEYLAKVLKDKGEDTAKPIILLGTVGAENTVKRTESAKAALEKSGLKLKVVTELAAKWDRSEAMTMIQPLVTTEDYNCIIANNDSMALGAIEALKAGGVKTTDIPVVGIDATVDGLDAVEKDEMAMTVFQDAVGQGVGSIIAAINLLEGNDIAKGTDYATDKDNPNIVWIPFKPVYKENVADFK